MAHKKKMNAAALAAYREENINFLANLAAWSLCTTKVNSSMASSLIPHAEGAVHPQCSVSMSSSQVGK